MSMDLERLEYLARQGDPEARERWRREMLRRRTPLEQALWELADGAAFEAALVEDTISEPRLKDIRAVLSVDRLGTPCLAFLGDRLLYPAEPRWRMLLPFSMPLRWSHGVCEAWFSRFPRHSPDLWRGRELGLRTMSMLSRVRDVAYEYCNALSSCGFVRSGPQEYSAADHARTRVQFELSHMRVQESIGHLVDLLLHGHEQETTGEWLWRRWFDLARHQPPETLRGSAQMALGRMRG
jgi:hypothetical protein